MTIAIVGAVVFLALLVERVIEIFVKPLIPEAHQGKALYVALVFGVALAVGFQVDAISPTLEQFGAVPLAPWVGMVVTGIVIGGGGNLIHDLWPS